MGEGENDDLTLSQTTNFRQFQTEKFADDNFRFDENGQKFSKWVKNTVGKGEIARYKQFILFPRCFQRHLIQTGKNLGSFGKGLSSLQAIYPFSHSVFKRLIAYYSH